MQHQPVLLNETIDHLITDPHGIYVDCTLGGGGHFRHLLSKLEPDAYVLGLDKDLEILNQTKNLLDIPNIKLIHSDFRCLSKVLKEENISSVDGIMMDLGVSSFQLDISERGFSYHDDAHLDMRMNREQALDAWDIVNTYPEEEIADIIFSFGEERFARRIARAIVSNRKEKSIDTTLELVGIIKSSVPARYLREKHPARKTFQALRISVNGELEAVKEVLPQAVEALKPGGRLCVITFHSLEDRIVKQFFQAKSKDCICPPGLPVCTCNHKAELKILNRKPITPGDIECEINPRARSAKLRTIAKI